MKQITAVPFGVKTEHPEQNFLWASNPSIQKLLDVVIHILANEYVRAVKENPTLFKEIASGPSLDFARDRSAPHNDRGDLI